jgi:hypothetical protein
VLLLPVHWRGRMVAAPNRVPRAVCRLTPQDSAAIVTELERLKTPYQLGDNGTTILVDKDAARAAEGHGQGVAAAWRVGFELFNNTDFGATEFAQKINYQRALQGELTRHHGAGGNPRRARASGAAGAGAVPPAE